jgi:uncharacterized protein
LSAPNVELVRRLFADFEAGAIDAVFATFDPDIEWIEPLGYFAGAGGVRGIAAVGEVFAAYPSTWTDFSLVPEDYLDAGDTVVVTGAQRGTSLATGKSFHGRFCNVWTLSAGKVVRFEAFADTALMWRALGAHPPEVSRD